jgi:hypothetical protein
LPILYYSRDTQQALEDGERVPDCRPQTPETIALLRMSPHPPPPRARHLATAHHPYWTPVALALAAVAIPGVFLWLLRSDGSSGCWWRRRQPVAAASARRTIKHRTD